MKGFKLTCEPIIFLYAFIFAINYTSLPQLVLEKVCLQENHANQTECKHPEKLPDSLQEVICLFSSSTLMFRYGHLTVANWCRKSIGPNFSRKKTILDTLLARKPSAGATDTLLAWKPSASAINESNFFQETFTQYLSFDLFHSFLQENN